MNYSLILEWDNARLSELARARKMLDSLPTQTRDVEHFARLVEIILMYDPGVVDLQLIQQVVAEQLGPFPIHDAVRVVAAPGLDYYDLKDRGAAIATGDVLVFVDSDVIPEPGWLLALLAPMQSDQVDLICGNTYISPENVYAKTFALFWFFPLRDTSTGIRPTDTFFANSYAIRRTLMRKNPYPVTGQYRGRCAYLAKQLRSQNVTIWYQPEARVGHPPPNGLKHFLSRAAYDGYDALVRAEADPGYEHSFKACYWHLRGALQVVWRNIVHGREKVGLRRRELPLAMFIGSTYYLISTLVVTLFLFAPRQMRRRFAT